MSRTDALARVDRELAELAALPADIKHPAVDLAMAQLDWEHERRLIEGENGRQGEFMMRFAYADPPYIGQAKRHYSHDPQCAEVDHAALVARLVAEYPDGWALSCSSPTLQQIIAYCPTDVRVMAWVKPFRAFKANVNPAYAWEPVIVRGGRKRTRQQPTVRDWLAESITLQRGLCGAKPKEFCYWLCDVLNVEPGDEVEDMFPGTGIFGRCLAEYVAGSALIETPIMLALGEAL